MRDPACELAERLEFLGDDQLLLQFEARVFRVVQGEFGSRSKLIDSILAFDNQSKNEGLRTRLGAYPVPRLYDLYRSKKRTADAKKRAEAPKA